MAALLNIVLGVVVVLLLTAMTGYFVAQEFGYMAVDRSRLKARAATGDLPATRALGITGRTSFMLSGAQLGITLTGLLVGYVAEPMIGAGFGDLSDGVGVPQTVGLVVGTTLALLLSTVVQMVFGELFPKNLAIARPESVALRLARSTAGYLRVFGWLIWLFDQAAVLLLKALRIEPVHDVEHAATPRDLRYIVAESRDSGDLPGDLSVLLDRMLEFDTRTAEHAMIPRPRVTTIGGGEPVRDAVLLMAAGHSRIPVLGNGVDDIQGVIDLRDVLELETPAREQLRARDLARAPVLVLGWQLLPNVLRRLQEAGEELACVVDEHGALSGILTVEDLGEELVGEITDEHDQDVEGQVHRADDGGWLVPGAAHIDEVERLIGHDLPRGDYETIGGLVIAELRRLPRDSDSVTVDLPHGPALEDESVRQAAMTVCGVARHVPERVRLHLNPPAVEETP